MMNKLFLLTIFGVTVLTGFMGCCAQNLPGGIQPGAVFPPVHVPEVSIPTVSIPTVQIPNIRIPDVSFPPVNIPDVKMPDVKIPDFTNPTVQIPDMKMPDVKIPTPFVPNDTLTFGGSIGNIPTLVPFTPNPEVPIWAKPVQTLDYRLFTEVTTPTPVPREGKERYDEAMNFYNEGKYFSAQQAFTESKYGDWKKWADKCPQNPPATGEVSRESTQGMQNMELTVDVSQSSASDMFFRIYKDENPISYIYISGSDKVSVMLPGNAAYSIKYGIGRTWYGEREAFGRSGTYETMVFDGEGSESVYLQSGYSYTLSINVSEADGGSNVDSRRESWENFTE